ncbi:hypothetical protein RF11_02369 [Thelohanellus kitauei]|uniref:Uncharacterized protein n=1 Tax=Thelohanellus kitauei TaxID=669202 RepID=A0A0C2IU97_THEKT|nr:hypothetical protein RF11_02369 [Thelohanellus kitauei]
MYKFLYLPEVVNGIVVEEIPNPTDISLILVPFQDHYSDILPLLKKIFNVRCRHWSSFVFLLFGRRHVPLCFLEFFIQDFLELFCRQFIFMFHYELVYVILVHLLVQISGSCHNLTHNFRGVSLNTSVSLNEG